MIIKFNKITLGELYNIYFIYEAVLYEDYTYSLFIIQSMNLIIYANWMWNILDDSV